LHATWRRWARKREPFSRCSGSGSMRLPCTHACTHALQQSHLSLLHLLLAGQRLHRATSGFEATACHRPSLGCRCCCTPHHLGAAPCRAASRAALHHVERGGHHAAPRCFEGSRVLCPDFNPVSARVTRSESPHAADHRDQAHGSAPQHASCSISLQACPQAGRGEGPGVPAWGGPRRRGPHLAEIFSACLIIMAAPTAVRGADCRWRCVPLTL
jgi:hypothetical protein